MSRYKKDHSQDDLELNELEAEQKAEIEKRSFENLPTTNEEEETWKKRHGDLRSHAQKKENDYIAKIREAELREEALRRQLDEAVKDNIKLPNISSKEEAEAWVREYPDLAKVLRYLAKETNEDMRSSINSTKEELDRLRAERQMEEAKTVLSKLHPDWSTVINSEAFAEWIEGRSDAYKRAIYQELDPHNAADVIDVFKVQVLGKKKDKKDENRRAAEVVTKPTPSNPPSGDNETAYSESLIERMDRKDPKWFEKNEEKIMESVRKGTFVYDLSGAAR